MGALASAKLAAALIARGELNMLATLILDGGSMRAGAKFQAGVFTWNDNFGGFKRHTVGSIPLRGGTDEHRVERVICLFEDMLAAVKALPFFLSNEDRSRIEGLSIKDLLKSIGAYPLPLPPPPTHLPYGRICEVCSCILH
eukprot:SAG11_NODE_2298_length_3552_cov_11.614538_5_plen_141_part_00